MGTLSAHPRRVHAPPGNSEYRRLKDERRKVSGRLAKLDRELAKHRPVTNHKKNPTTAELNRWFDELAEELDHVPCTVPFVNAMH